MTPYLLSWIICVHSVLDITHLCPIVIKQRHSIAIHLSFTESHGHCIVKRIVNGRWNNHKNKTDAP